MKQQQYGYTVATFEDVMVKYEEFKKEWTDKGKPKLYFVGIDIKKCYDNIDAKKLMEFLR